MDIDRIDEIEPAYRSLMGRLGLDANIRLPRVPTWSGGYHIEFAEGEFRYIISDDFGSFVLVQQTSDEAELLDWIAVQEASWLATKRRNDLALPIAGAEGTLALFRFTVETLEAVDHALALQHEAKLREQYRALYGEQWFRPIAS